MLKVGDIECAVLRSARRSVGIYVERDGSICVRAPLAVDDLKLAKLVEKKLPWIYRNVALWRELNQDAPRREFVSGESFYVAGQPCILDVRDNAEQATRACRRPAGPATVQPRQGRRTAAGALPAVGLRAPPGAYRAVLLKDGRHSRETPGMGASQPLGVLLLGG